MAQLLQDYEDVDEVNTQLEKMFVCWSIGVLRVICLFSLNRGYNIGLRLIDEFLARSGVGRCQSFKDTGEVIAKVPYTFLLANFGDVHDPNLPRIGWI